jgi:hypothetical protein
MATVTPRPTFNRADADRRVRHPLHALRGHIRRYVTVEGAAVAVLYLALWFWVGLAFDYGLFALFGFDWIKELDRAAGESASFWMRAVILFGLLAGLVAVVALKVIRRLMREFSDPALALVLERRFPRELGDRLITAVELADPKLSEKYGYSQTMLDQTIRDAADRVEKLPVHEVFNWARLRAHVIWAGVATVGVYLVVALASCITAGAMGRSASPVDFFHEFNYVAGTWVERNIFLQEHRYWLGNEYLEFVRFPGNEKGEMRVARDEYRPDVTVRALKWVVADRGPEAPEGWRALRWSDLPNLLDKSQLQVNLPADWPAWVIDLDDLDPRVPAGVVAPEWGWQNKTAAAIRKGMKKPEVRAALDSERGRLSDARAAVERLLDWRTWTVDKIELQLKRKDVRDALRKGHEADLKTFERVLTALAELADSPRMRGTLRQLRIPEVVTAHRRGKKTKSSSPLTKQDNYKFSFNLNELKESVDFHFSGDEYSTPSKKVTLVPPPALSRMLIDKDEPAYIHYRLLGDDSGKLRGLRQIFRGVPVSTDGAKTIIPVPLGASVTVTATINRKLKRGTARVTEPVKRDDPGSETRPAPVTVHDEYTFSARFENIRRLIEFEFEFRDEDNVRGRRHVVLRPVDDQPPKLIGVALAVTLRPDYDPETSKAPPSASGERLLITPNALLPFKGRAEDDYGLASVDYRYEVLQVPFQKLGESNVPAKEGSSLQGTQATRRAGLVLSTFQYAPGVQSFAWFAPAWVGKIAGLTKADLPEAPARPETGQVEADFARVRLTTRDDRNDVTYDEMLRLLQIQPRNRPLAVELLELKDAKQRSEFVQRLKSANRQEGLLEDVLHFLGVPRAERAALRPQITSDPGKVVERILEIAGKDTEKRKAALDLLKKQPEKMLIREHPLNQEAGFDVRKHLPAIKATGRDTQKHYELRLFLTATDNNVETGPGKAVPKGPFLFLVVSENELIAEIIKQERKLYNLLKESVDNLEGRKTTLDGELLSVTSPGRDLSLVAARADLAKKAVRETGDIARAVLGKYRLILTELRVNRVEGPKFKKLEDRVVAPLDDLTDKKSGFIPKVVDRNITEFWGGVEADLAKLKKAQDAKTVDDALLKELAAAREVHKITGEQASQDIGRLIKHLRDVLEAMQDTIEADKLIELMVRIEAEQREATAELERRRHELEQDLLNLLGEEPKGQKK